MDFDVPVLIVGAGPVGLAVAGDLGWRGVSCIAIDQSDGCILQPRMDLVSIRTMEFCRRWGLSDAVKHCPYPQDYGQDNIFVTSVTGYELARDKRPNRAQAQAPAYSPQRRERCPQNMFDPILLKHAQSMPHVEIKYRLQLTSFEQDETGVTAYVKNLETNTEEKIRARYLIGCDGSSSLVRRSLPVKMIGNETLTYSVNAMFHCPNFNSLHDKGEVYRYVFIGADGVWATMVAIDGESNWRFQYVGDKDSHDNTEEKLRELIERAMGKTFDYELTSIMPWTRRQLVADQFCFERVFLVGDAAHELSPTGAFGMNTGMQEAVDIAWKLDAILKGWGGDDLLRSYDVERRPIAEKNVNEAAGNLTRMVDAVTEPKILEDTPEGDAVRERVGSKMLNTMVREWHADGIHMGYFYNNSNIIVRDGTPAPKDDPVVVTQSARPGCRAPHVWISDNHSTLDLFGRGFVLLILGDNKAKADVISTALEKARVPFDIEYIGAPAICDLYEMKFVLVRPDGHVAWRSNTLPDDATQIIDTVRGQLS